MTAEVQPAVRRILPPARTAVLLGLLVLVGFVIRIDALRNSAPDVPPLGWVALTLAYAASMAVWIVVLATLVEPRVESIGRETERRLRSVDAAA